MQRRMADGRLRFPRVMFALLTGAWVLVLGCASPVIAPAPISAPVTLAEPSPPENVDVYRDAGFIVGRGEIPFVGFVRFAATEFFDSTTVFVALSIPPRALSFVRAGDRYAAFYAVRIEILLGESIVRRELPSGEVRVAGFAETTRGDEGVIFQRALRVAPGSYTIRLAVQDSLGVGTGTVVAPITVPTLADGAVAPIIPVFAAEPRRSRNIVPTFIANPRATVRYGRDATLQFYVEAYGAAAPDTVLLIARRGDDDEPVFTDTVRLDRGTGIRSALAAIPVHRLGLGRVRVSVAATNATELASTSALVTLGVDLPVTSIDELLDALRYFATGQELQRFRVASAEARPRQWAELMRRTDPNPSSPENEAFVEYARRLRVAAAQYGEGSVPGWNTDRGAVVAALGEPDSRSPAQPADSVGVARVMTWEYRRHRLFLVFADADGSGRWRLTPVSDADFRSLLALSGLCIGCR